MIIGVAAVITMVALGIGRAGGDRRADPRRRHEHDHVFPGSVNTGGVKQGEGTSSKLVPDDAKALRTLPEVEYVSEGLQTRQQVIYSNQNWQTNIVGVNVDYVQIKAWPMKYGVVLHRRTTSGARRRCARSASTSPRTCLARTWTRRARRCASATRSSTCSA